MSRFFPGVQARMGRWTYYLVKMKMRELHEVKFASEMQEGSGLAEALQRDLDANRSSRQIVTYLQETPDRFFNSIVIAGIGGKPKWFPVDMAEDPRLAMLGDGELSSSFGVLRFDGTEDMYAIDGQHRLYAIKKMTDPTSDAYINRPKDFENEELSVVLVVPGDVEDRGEFLKRYRRLFSNLNRYAKPMDKATTIILDEDDAIAICLRNIFHDHKFFKTAGPERDSTIIDTRKGKSMRAEQVHFTNIETLYSMFEKLLESRDRKNSGWDSDSRKTNEFIRFRPDESKLESLTSELSNIWTALLEVLPVLKSPPYKMRNHSVAIDPTATEDRDHFLFWPLGQDVLAAVARSLLDDNGITDESKLSEIVLALKPLQKVNWDLNFAPWIHLIIEPTASGNWKMRDTDRAKVQTFAISLILGLLMPGLDETTLDEFKKKYVQYLVFLADDPRELKEVRETLWLETLKSFAH